MLGPQAWHATRGIALATRTGDTARPMSPVALLLPYCLLIVGASLLGGWVPMLVRLTHRRMELLLSFVSGVMLGVALLHLLPHAWMELSGTALPEGQALSHELILPVMGWMLGGFLAMFLVERFFCFHHHDAPAGERAATGHAGLGHELTWTGAAIGLTVHSLVAGVALAASVEAEMGGAAAGLGTFLAVVLHKPFDSMTLGTLMAAGRRSPRSRHLVNFSFGLVVPAGVGLFYLGAELTATAPPGLVSAALAFSAGTFLCISLSDLLPELQFHQHDRFKLSAALLAGIALAWAVGKLEAGSHADHARQVLTPVGRWISSSDHAPASGRHHDRHYQAPVRAGRDRCTGFNTPFGLALGGADVVSRGWLGGVAGAKSAGGGRAPVRRALIQALGHGRLRGLSPSHPSPFVHRAPIDG